MSGPETSRSQRDVEIVERMWTAWHSDDMAGWLGFFEVVRSRGKASGAEVDLAYTFVYRLREGKIVEISEYTRKAEALAALDQSF